MQRFSAALCGIVVCLLLHPLSATALNRMLQDCITQQHLADGSQPFMQVPVLLQDSETAVALEDRLFPCPELQNAHPDLFAINAPTETQLPVESIAEFQSAHILQQNIESDTPRSMQDDEIPWSEYLYAVHARYTIDGMPPLRNSHINYLALGATGSVYLGIMVGLHIYQMQTFWASKNSRISILEDGSYAKGVDKFGHLFGATIMSYYSTEVLQGSGVSVESAHIWGTLMGIMYQTYVEIEDGYGKEWGFSPTDMYMNLLGATWYLTQYYVPALQNVTEKWIYTPASWIKELPRANSETFIDDYSLSTFFYSFKVVNIFPKVIANHWPRWLNVAFGYAARGLDTPNEDTKMILALDYDFPELFPDFRVGMGGFWGDFCNWVVQSLNYIKFPSPAIEVGSHGMTRFNLLYPFKLSIGSVHF